jgi:integrase
MTSRRGPHEGSIYRRSDGRWTAALHVGYRDGHRVRKQFYGRTRSDVASKLARALRDLQSGLKPGDDRTTIERYLSTWLEDIRPTIRPKTYSTYASAVRLHIVPLIGRLAVSRLTPQDVQRLLNSALGSGLSPRSVGIVHEVLRNALNTAVRWGLVARNVAASVSSPTYRRPEMRTLTVQQAGQLVISVRGTRFEALYVAALGLGLRQGEILGLTWADIDLDNGALRVQRSIQRIDGKLQFADLKTDRSRRSLRLPPTVVAALRVQRLRQLEERLRAADRWVDNDLVFASHLGRPLDGRYVLRAFTRAVEAAGLPRMRFHDLRHSCASILLSQGVSPRVVMEILGHSQISLTLDTYAHVVPELREDAASRMDRVLSGVG